MEAQRSARVAMLSARAVEPLGGMLRCLAWSTAAVLLATSLVLLARRAAGALQQPLEGAMLVALGAGASAGAFALHAAWRSGESRAARRTEPARFELLFTLAVSAALAALGAAVSLPGSSLVALLLMWALLVGQESAWWVSAARRSRGGQAIAQLANRWKSARRHRARRGSGRVGRAAANARHEPLSDARPAPLVAPRASDDLVSPMSLQTQEQSAGDSLAPGVSQQVMRAVEENGEALYGLLRADFAPRQRTQSLHVAFCPPLAAAPTIECRQVEGPEAAIKAAQVQPFGARFDLRLASIPREATSVVVQFEARCRTRSDNELKSQIANHK